MTQIGSVIAVFAALGCITLIAAVLALGSGGVSRRPHRAGRRVVASIVAFVLLVFLLVLFAIHAVGRPHRTVTGAIVGKSEQAISTIGDVLPTRWSRLVFKVKIDDEIYTLEPSQASFDSHRLGDRLDIVLVGPERLRMAQVRGESGFSLPWRRFQGLFMFLARLADLAAVCAVIAGPFAGARLRLWLGALVISAIVLSGFAFRDEFARRPATAQAILDEVRPIDHLRLQKRDGVSDVALPQPYVDVTFHFQPPLAVDQITAFDRIDGPATLPSRGEPVTVRYDPADPRRARLVAGRRSFLWKDLAARAPELLIEGVAQGLALVLLCLWLGRRRQRPAPGK